MSAVNHVKHGSYSKRPQDCPCPVESRRFTGFDLTVDMYICVECGAMHRIRSKEYDKDVVLMDRKLKEALG